MQESSTDPSTETNHTLSTEPKKNAIDHKPQPDIILPSQKTPEPKFRSKPKPPEIPLPEIPKEQKQKTKESGRGNFILNNS